VLPGYESLIAMCMKIYNQLARLASALVCRPFTVGAAGDIAHVDTQVASSAHRWFLIKEPH
jgi:hypothetical protein